MMNQSTCFSGYDITDKLSTWVSFSKVNDGEKMAKIHYNSGYLLGHFFGTIPLYVHIVIRKLS